MKWIKVEDELPKVGMLCLLKKTYPEGTTFNLLAHPLPRCHIVIGGLRYNGKFISYDDQYSKDGIIVSHWMPLPKFPEGSIEHLEFCKTCKNELVACVCLTLDEN